MFQALIDLQGVIHEQVGARINAFAADRAWGPMLAMLPLGIVFGAVHALTPGHSKMVLATYLAGTPTGFARGFLVALALAATHVAMAVIIALFALPLVVRTLGGAGDTPQLDDISRGLIGLIGLWLIVQAFRTKAASVEVHTHQGWFAGLVAGLIPCPLTLFVMTLAMVRGVPEAGLAFAGIMLIGVTLTLGVVALLAVAGRQAVLAKTKLLLVQQVLTALAGAVLVVIAATELIG